MKKQTTLLIARTGILMAIVFALQAILLRFLPNSVFSTILTGSVVNLVLIIATSTCGLTSGILIGLLTPVMAFFQNKLPLAILIPIVGAGNALIVAVFWSLNKYLPNVLSKFKPYIAVVGGSLVKFAFMYISILTYVPKINGIKPPQVKALTLGWSYPQLVAALVGGFIAIPLIAVLAKAGFSNIEKVKATCACKNSDCDAIGNVNAEDNSQNISLIDDNNNENKGDSITD